MKTEPITQGINRSGYNTEGYINNPNRGKYPTFRKALKNPVMNTAQSVIINIIANSNYTISIPENQGKRIRKHIMDHISPLWYPLVANALNAIFYGFQVGEFYVKEEKINRFYPPALPIFPYPETIKIAMGEGEFIGFKQIHSNWFSGDRTTPVTAEESYLWRYGGMLHNNPYGQGILEIVSPLVQERDEAVDNALATAYSHADPLVFVGINQKGYGRAGTDGMVEDVEAELLTNRILVYRMAVDNQLKVESIPTSNSAVADIMSIVEYYDRQIAMAAQIALRAFYSSPDEGGSYNLVEVQRSVMDQRIAGMMDMIEPGIAYFISWWLSQNGYDIPVEVQIEKPDELSMRAARQTLNNVINMGFPEALNRLDLDKLSSIADYNIFKDNKPNTRKGYKTTNVKGTDIQDRAKELREVLDGYVNKNTPKAREELESSKNITNTIRKWINTSIAQAKSIYREYVDSNIPTLPDDIEDDWKSKPKHWSKAIKRKLEAINDGIHSLAIRYGPQNDKLEGQLDNAYNTLVERILGSANIYFQDLMRAGNKGLGDDDA